MYLDQIVVQKKLEVARLKETTTQAALEDKIAELPPCLDFTGSLRHSKRRMGLIAEVKKASPSKGLIRPDFHPVSLAMDYEAAGTDCISVLTDESFFQGSNEFLRQIRARVDVPILRKDFTIDPMQIYEARAIGADAVLLIAAILNDAELGEFSRIADKLGMSALVEVHNEEELARALKLNAALIGINNRNLHTFETDIRTTGKLVNQIADDHVIISESGISRTEEINYLAELGVDGVLIGESFMRKPDAGQAVRDLMGQAETEGRV